MILYLHITKRHHSNEITIIGDTSSGTGLLNCCYRVVSESKKEFSDQQQNKRKYLGKANPNKENRSPGALVEGSVKKKSKMKTSPRTFHHLKQTEVNNESDVSGETFKREEFDNDLRWKKFKGKQGLKCHVKLTRDDADVEIECESKTCDKLFDACNQFRENREEIHVEKDEIEGREHENSQSVEKRFKCDPCKISFDRSQDLKSHARERHGEGKTFCECDVCKKCFGSKKRILQHLVKAHLGEDLTKVDDDDDSNVPDIFDDGGKKRCKRKRLKLDKPFKCDYENCEYSASQFAFLKNHKNKHNPFYECVTCFEKFTGRSELKAHMSTHGERPYKCDQCNKCYKDKHGLGWHKKVQHDPSRLKFTCELCGKTYPFDSLLTQHINLTHATEKQSVCDICGKNVSKTYLPMHRRTHGEKQHECDVCRKTFLEKAYLKRHKMIHTGEKPYVCNVCGNLFRQHSTLTIHMRTHTGDRPYKCVTCENAYKTHHNLKKHYKRSGHKMV